MALASTTWGDYRVDAPASSSTKPWRSLLGTLLAGTLVLSCGLAGMAALERMETFHPARSAVRPNALSAEMAAAKRELFAKLSEPLLQRNAERFIEDSFLLTECGADCSELVAVVSSDRSFGRFGPVAASLPTQPHLTAPAAASTSPAETSPAPIAAAAAPESSASTAPAASAPVRITPSIVVPLPPVATQSIEAPLPAPRLDRPAGKTTEFSALGEPVEETTPPPAARIAPPVTVPAIGRNSGVAIYDISAATVYLPDGERLEAHSGVGYMADNPRYVDRRNIGPTPPNTYNLVMRKGRFHGVEALRLLPVDGNNKYGRVGLLAHTYLLRGRPAESNGCVAFKDYARFLAAFKRGDIKRLIVVPSLRNSPLQVASAGDR